MSYKLSTYAIRTEELDGVIRYFVSFKDGQAVFHEIEVSHEMYLEFRGFIRKEYNLRQSEWRHNEFSELTDETLNRRARFMPNSVEETIVERERMETYRRAVAELPEIQRRRFVRYYEYGMTYAAIGRLESCSATSVKSSVDIAKEKIKAKLKDF